MWVFSEFSVPIVPLTKCSYHFSGLQTQIVLDAQTFFAWKPPVCQCKGNNKKSWCFWTFCLSQLFPHELKRQRIIRMNKLELFVGSEKFLSGCLHFYPVMIRAAFQSLSLPLSNFQVEFISPSYSSFLDWFLLISCFGHLCLCHDSQLTAHFWNNNKKCLSPNVLLKAQLWWHKCEHREVFDRYRVLG